MKCILGKKMGMTQVFRDDGTVVPVTIVQAGPCVVTQIKTEQRDGVNAIQIGFGEKKLFRANKAAQGHVRGLTTIQWMRDMRTTETESSLHRGDTFTVSIFSPGEKVSVVGRSKGKGFQGVVRRHGFAGGPASHGHKDNLRMPGSIGAGGVQRVFKDMRMAGHMGDQQVTIKNLEIVTVSPEKNEMLLKGAIPGAPGSLVVISNNEGTIVVEPKTHVDESVSVPTPTETAPEEKQPNNEQK